MIDKYSKSIENSKFLVNDQKSVEANTSRKKAADRLIQKPEYDRNADLDSSRFLIPNKKYKRMYRKSREDETLEREIIKVLRYFNIFYYPPTLEEICTFLKKKAQKRQIMSILEKMEKE